MLHNNDFGLSLIYLQEEHYLFPIYPAFSLSAAVSLTLLPVGDHPYPCVICYLFTSPQAVAPVVLGILHIPCPLKWFSRWILTWLPLITGFVFTTLSVSHCYALYKGNLRDFSVAIIQSGSLQKDDSACTDPFVV